MAVIIMENIQEIDVEKYCNNLYEIAEKVETGTIILPYYESKITRYAMMNYNLLERRIRQDKPETEIYLRLQKHFKNEALRLENKVEKINEILVCYSGKIGIALNFLLPDSKEQNFVSIYRKSAFDVDLGSFERDLKAKAIPKEQIIKQHLDTQKYHYSEYYVSGKPLQANEENRVSVLCNFAQDLATYDFIKYLNDEKEEEIKEIQKNDGLKKEEKFNIPARLMLLEKLRFFELPLMTSISPNKQAELLSRVLGVDSRQVRNYYNGEFKGFNKEEYESKIAKFITLF